MPDRRRADPSLGKSTPSLRPPGALLGAEAIAAMAFSRRDRAFDPLGAWDRGFERAGDRRCGNIPSLPHHGWFYLGRPAGARPRRELEVAAGHGTGLPFYFNDAAQREWMNRRTLDGCGPLPIAPSAGGACRRAFSCRPFGEIRRSPSWPQVNRRTWRCRRAQRRARLSVPAGTAALAKNPKGASRSRRRGKLLRRGLLSFPRFSTSTCARCFDAFGPDECSGAPDIPRAGLWRQCVTCSPRTAVSQGRDLISSWVERCNWVGWSPSPA